MQDSRDLKTMSKFSLKYFRAAALSLALALLLNLFGFVRHTQAVPLLETPRELAPTISDRFTAVLAPTSLLAELAEAPAVEELTAEAKAAAKAAAKEAKQAAKAEAKKLEKQKELEEKAAKSKLKAEKKAAKEAAKKLKKEQEAAEEAEEAAAKAAAKEAEEAAAAPAAIAKPTIEATP
jgi:hypothetical protein